MAIAAAGAASLFPAHPAPAATSDAIRPFRVNVPEEDLDELRRRIAATRWPDRETVDDQSQGIQLAKLKPLVEYWGTGYDWRKAEAKLNALPQFMTDDRRRRHPLHSRPLEASQRPAADHDPWLAGLGVRAAQGHRSAHRSDRAWRSAPRTRSTSSFRRCRATASPASRRTPAGVPTASREPGRS